MIGRDPGRGEVFARGCHALVRGPLDCKEGRDPPAGAGPWAALDDPARGAGPVRSAYATACPALRPRKPPPRVPSVIMLEAVVSRNHENRDFGLLFHIPPTPKEGVD